MRKAQRNRFYALSLLSGTAAGTLLWEIAERLLSAAGFDISLSAGPVGFDISVLAVYIKLNPGSIAGALLTWFIIKNIR